MHYEQVFIGAAMQDASLIDHAIAEGVRSDTFASPDYARIWSCMMELRAKGQLTDSGSIILSMGAAAPMDVIFDAEKASPTSAHGKKAMRRLIWESQKRNLRPALNDVLSMVDDDAKPDDILKAVESLTHHVRPAEADTETLEEIIAAVELWAKQEVDRTREAGDTVITGLPTFDNYAMPIESHEYCIVGARPSVGKSSFSAHVAGVNLNRGLRTAVFTLETSAKAVARQIAGQRAGVNLKRLYEEMPNKQADFFKEAARLKTQPLRIFDKDMTMQQIEARCRVLAASWKPQLVIIDYLGLIRGFEGSAYERMSQVSKSMIPLRKVLGCSLIVAAQFNRAAEKEARAPSSTDFRDSGSIEEDAHRIVALHRPSKDWNGQPQELGQATYDYEMLQLKLRDGPLAHARIKYHAPHTKFYEEAQR